MHTVTHCTGESVQSIISAAYPSILISSYETNAKYGSLDYVTVCLASGKTHNWGITK